MEHVMNLNDLVALTAKNWPFNNEKYPGLASLPENQKRIFAVRHILMHQIKSCGELSGLVEACDHGEALHGIKAVNVIEKMFTNVLRLINVVGVKVDDLDLPVQSSKKFLMQIGEEKKYYLSLTEAGIAYDCGWVDVKICGSVLENDGLIRPITEEERQAIAKIAEEYGASK